MAQYPIVPREGGNFSALNLTASTIVKASPGTAFRVNVTVAGTTTGALYDTDVVASAAASNLICVVPDAVGTTEIVWPCRTGIVFVPGAGQTASVSYS